MINPYKPTVFFFCLLNSVFLVILEDVQAQNDGFKIIRITEDSTAKANQEQWKRPKKLWIVKADLLSFYRGFQQIHLEYQLTALTTLQVGAGVTFGYSVIGSQKSGSGIGPVFSISPRFYLTDDGPLDGIYVAPAFVYRYYKLGDSQMTSPNGSYTTMTSHLKVSIPSIIIGSQGEWGSNFCYEVLIGTGYKTEVSDKWNEQTYAYEKNTGSELSLILNATIGYILNY